ncbi:MAG TPA: carboxypeptidase regulatory-like domain-containing protein [Bryobacteraceae bacterium]|nr:carboxypeptidase regulatory-like domain-containing protein [Bryobacteraceae bacterium]
MYIGNGKWKTAVLLVCALSAVPGLLAQTTGDLRGTVKDPSGLVIAGASVKATLEGTSTVRTASSDAKGDFFIAALPVGPYTVEVETSGFKKFVQHVDITLGHVVVVDAMLQIGEITQSITAEAEAALVETTSTQLGAVMNSRSVVDLPLNTRDTYQLLQLQPGVQSQQGYSLFAGSENAGVVSVNGGRGRANNFNVNGGDANDQFVAVPAVEPSPDTIEEFRVLTNTFDAEYGRNSGSVVNVVTKGGTNSFHGDAYEFFRNTVLDARGFFDTTRPDFHQNQFGGTFGGPIKKNKTFFFASLEDRQIVQGLPSDVVTVPTQAERNGDFSALTPFSTASCDQGGPCLNDDYLASVLNQRPGCAAAVGAAGGAPITAGTPWGAIFPNNQIPTPCFDPTAAALMNRYVPLPNIGGSNYQAVANQTEKGIQSTFRLDQHINDHHQLSFYYYFDNDTQLQPFANFEAAGADVPGFGANFSTRNQQFNLSETWTATPTVVNEARFTYFREGQLNYNHPQNAQLIQSVCGSAVPAANCFSDPNNPQYGITPNLGANHEGVPYISVSGGFAIGNNFEGELPQIGNSFQWTDSLSKVTGTHSLKFGVDVRRMRFDQTLYYNVNGSYSFTGGGTDDVGADDLYPDFLLGLPNSYSQGSAQHENVRSTALYLFAQDSWKIRPNLTLNYGLRWELDAPLTDIGHHVQTFRPGQVTSIYPCQLAADNPLVQQFGSTDCSQNGPGNAVFPLGLVFPGDTGIPAGMTQTYYKAFAPRIGLAWSPSADSGFLHKLTGAPGKTSIRAGWGIFYNPIEQLVLEQFSAEPPFGGSSSVTDPMFNTPFVDQGGNVTPNPFNGILNPPRGQPVDWSSFRPLLLYGQFQPNMRTQYSEQYNFTVQREFPGDVLFQIGYVGTQAHRLLASYDLNYGNPQTCLDLNNLSNLTGDGSLACGPFYADSAFTIAAGEIPAGFTLHLPYGPQPTVTGPNANPITLVGLRRYSSPNCNPLTGAGCPPDGVPVFSSIFTENTIANSNYNSLQISAEKRFSHGLQFQAAYTFSKSIDNASSFENMLNPLNFRNSRALSLFDARNRLVVSYVYQFPHMDIHGFADKLFNGWQSSGIVTFQSGFPVPIASSSDLELMYSAFFSYPGEPNQVAPLQRLNPRGPGNLAFDTSAFQQLGPDQYGTIGDSPRSVCCGPGINNIDFSLMKDTTLKESLKLEFRAEFFNIVNHAQFTKVDGNISDSFTDPNTGVVEPGTGTFGKVLQSRDPRLVQFALKLIF